MMANNEYVEMADIIICVADYLQTNLAEGRGVEESRWRDGLMEVHGRLLDLADQPDPRVILCSHTASPDADSPDYTGWSLEIWWGPIACQIILLQRRCNAR